MDLCQLLNLEERVVRANAIAYEGYALARQKEENILPALASHYMAISASYWSVVEPAHALEAFVKSSELAKRQEYWRANDVPVDSSRAFGWRLRAAFLGSVRESV